jgi:hypothetical protein
MKCFLGLFCALIMTPALATPLAAHPIVVAVRHGDCAAAVKLVNANVAAPDQQTAFLAARMLDEGICVQKDQLAATEYFARAADLGDQSAALDYAAKVGLGEGVEQSYERAGILCRAAGLDPRATLSAYALGYACTLRAVAGELLRETLPKGAFQSGISVAMVEFSPAKPELQVHSTPRVGLEEAHTGSNVRNPLIDARQEIEKAWRSALALVPKPDASRLDVQSIELPLDVDMTLEVGHDSNRRGNDTLLYGDIKKIGQ